MWIEVHDELPLHPKTRRVARRLGVQPEPMVGHLVCGWLWTLRFASPGGVVDADDVPEFVAATGYPGEVDEFINALMTVGWLDPVDGQPGAVRIHDWMDYGGKAAVVKAARADDGKRGAHVKWHANRGKVDPSCQWCQPADSPPMAPHGPPIGPHDGPPSNGHNDAAGDTVGGDARDEPLGVSEPVETAQQQRNLGSNRPPIAPLDSPPMGGACIPYLAHNTTQQDKTKGQTPCVDAVDTADEPAELTLAVQDAPDPGVPFQTAGDAYPRNASTGKPYGGAPRKVSVEKWDKLTADEQRAALVGIGHYAAACNLPDATKPAHMTTWLHQRRWEDWQEPATPPRQAAAAGPRGVSEFTTSEVTQ